MRWLPFILCAGIVLTLQSALAPRLALGGVRPDWVLVMVIFYALHAKTPDSVIAGWALGLMADLLTVERFGLLSLSYGLAAAAVASVREYLFRSRAVTQFAVTLAVGVLMQTAWQIYRRALYAPLGSWAGDWVSNGLLASIYTAAWAPLFHRGLLSIARTLGIPRPQERLRHAPRTGGGRV